MDACVHGKAHGRLASQPRRLEHLAPPLLRPPATDLPVRVRASERHRLARRARGACHGWARPARRAPPPVDRRGAHPLRAVRRGCGADPRGRRRVARRRNRPLLDARLGEPGAGSRGIRHGRGERADDGGPARSRVLGAVVPGGLGLGDARADPVVVLLAALHVRGPRRACPVPQGAGLREDAGRDGPRDAQLVGKHDRRPGRVRADGRRRHALAVLRAATRPQPPLRVRPGARDPAEAADPLELVQVPRRLREHRRAGSRSGPISRAVRSAIWSRSTAGSSHGRTPS